MYVCWQCHETVDHVRLAIFASSMKNSQTDDNVQQERGDHAGSSCKSEARSRFRQEIYIFEVFSSRRRRHRRHSMRRFGLANRHFYLSPFCAFSRWEFEIGDNKGRKSDPDPPPSPTTESRRQDPRGRVENGRRKRRKSYRGVSIIIREGNLRDS